MEHIETPAQMSPMLESGSGPAREWASPGVSVRKRWLTGVFVALAALLFFWIALAEGASMLVSTLIGVVFIGCFVWYLTLVAPTPFTLRLDAAGVTRLERGAEPQTIAWEGVAKVKEEAFKNGMSVSLTLYKRVGERGLHRAWVIYRDDLEGFDALAAALRMGLPEQAPWIRET
ncbi:MAG TPA: hypothetical protein VKC57_00735, partial [Ktedonobacterales bacterium]|nr:hypothetical protein [Ktedonobacterales bacterium]